jgi:hypothetical protein
MLLPYFTHTRCYWACTWYCEQLIVVSLTHHCQQEEAVPYSPPRTSIPGCVGHVRLFVFAVVGCEYQLTCGMPAVAVSVGRPVPEAEVLEWAESVGMTSLREWYTGSACNCSICAPPLTTPAVLFWSAVVFEPTDVHDVADEAVRAQKRRREEAGMAQAEGSPSHGNACHIVVLLHDLCDAHHYSWYTSDSVPFP